MEIGASKYNETVEKRLYKYNEYLKEIKRDPYFTDTCEVKQLCEKTQAVLKALKAWITRNRNKVKGEGE